MSEVTIGNYDVVRRISDLPDGVLYGARNQRDGGEVLLKKLIPGSESCEGSRWGESLAETQRLVEIKDPRIGGEIDYLEEQGDLFLAVRAPQGETLRQKLATEEPPSERDALDWMAQLLSLLEVAHRLGVVHGHLDETSLIFDGTGRLHLLGFSLSGFSQDDPLFSAPERLQHPNRRTSKTDVYGAGMILMRLLEVVPFSDPEGLEQVAARALAAEPNQRFQTAVEMYEALGSPSSPHLEGSELTLDGSGPTLEVPQLTEATPRLAAAETESEELPPKSGSWLRMAGAALALLATLGVGLWFGSRSDSSSGQSQAKAVGPTLEEPTEPSVKPAERELTDRVQSLIADGRGEEAAAELEVALHGGWAGNPVPVLDLLGTLRLQQGRIEEAKGLLEQANAIEPTAERRYKYGLVLAALGEPNLAVEQFDLARGLEPSDRLALIIDRALARIRETELSK